MMTAIAPGGGHGVNSIIMGKIGLCNTSAKVTSRLHIEDAAYRGVKQLKQIYETQLTNAIIFR
jgi:hypothetical protein